MLLPGKRLLVLLPLFLLSFLVRAQEVEPYSRFGLGWTGNSVFTAQKGIGGLASAYRDPLHINFMNPASYTGLSLTAMEAGVNFTTKSIEDGQSGKTYRAGDGFFDYFAMGFPAGRRMGVSFGMIPYSSMNYTYSLSSANAVGDGQKLFEGNGRTYQIYGGAAYRFQRIDTMRNSLSVGMNFVYLFGTLNRDNVVQFPAPEYYNARITSAARLSNVALNFGLQYRRKLGEKNYAMLGAFSYLPVGVGSTIDETWSRYVRLASGTVMIDSVHQEKGDLPDMKIPVETGAGISFGEQGRWLAGAEFRYKMWSAVETFSPSLTFKDSWEVRAGAEMRPQTIVNSGLFKRMVYRLGGFYDKGYLELFGARVSEYGATFGLGIPLKTSFATLNFSFDVGSRGTTTNNLLKETFFRGYIGFTFNDKWFTRAKYD